MKPVDFRNATFADLQARIVGQREAALAAWRVHGPGTTEEVAARSGMSILSLRPRTTELFQLGFVVLDAADPGKGAGRYRVRTEAELREFVRLQQHFAANPQRQLSLGV